MHAVIKIKFYYDLSSPYSFFAWRRRTVLETAGAELEYTPVSIDILLNLQADREPWAKYQDPLAPPKRAHVMADIQRMSKYWDIPLGGPFSFKPQAKRAMCVATELQRRGLDQTEFIERASKTLWEDARDISDERVLERLIGESSLVEMSHETEASALRLLTRNTQAAYAAGVYGVPSFGHGNEIYFGADRMDVLAASLNAT